ncbi:MAG: hypothetical protein ABI882_21295 [Acidobacteriota bacterium]
MASKGRPNLTIVNDEMFESSERAETLLKDSWQRARQQQLTRQLTLNAEVRKRWIEADPMRPVRSERQAMVPAPADTSRDVVPSFGLLTQARMRRSSTTWWYGSLLALWHSRMARGIGASVITVPGSGGALSVLQERVSLPPLDYELQL